MTSYGVSYARRKAGTRNVVETAIDLSKRDKTSTWEKLTQSNPMRHDSPENRGPDDEEGSDTDESVTTQQSGRRDRIHRERPKK